MNLLGQVVKLANWSLFHPFFELLLGIKVPIVDSLLEHSEILPEKKVLDDKVENVAKASNVPLRGVNAHPLPQFFHHGVVVGGIIKREESNLVTNGKVL